MPRANYRDDMCLIIRARELPAEASASSAAVPAATSEDVGANCLDRVIDLEPGAHEVPAALVPDPRLAMETR
ncbi:hypothetical protein [Agromyces italicus]|uniref:hypothetical protein n=1 Tax=Agromyces italicus TaxID=279572 RepID=UPI0003B2FE39|nr:hypothetical protein [Agromyces italicus]